MSKRALVVAAVALITFCTQVARAQVATGQTDQGNENSDLTMTGLEMFSPGAGGAPAGSYIMPSVYFTGYGNTNPSATPGESGFVTSDFVVTNLALQTLGRHSQMNLDLSGGGFYDNTTPAGSAANRPGRTGAFEQVVFIPTFTWRRWRLVTGDEGSYLPESANGFYGFDGSESFAGGVGSSSYSSGPTLNPTAGPAQTILTGLARRISNVVFGQVAYAVGPKSIVTATTSYGTLHFLNGGYIDNDIWSFSGGYNRRLSRRSGFGISYTQSTFHYGVLSQQQAYRGLNLSYGYRLTSRLAAEVSGGGGDSEVTNPPAAGVSKLFLSTFDSLMFQSSRFHGQAFFARFLSGGSGVLAGAESQWVGVQFGRQMFRRTDAFLKADYQHNQPLAQAIKEQPQVRTVYWEGGPNLSYELSRTMSLYVNYQYERETSSSPLCFNSNCGVLVIRQVAGVGINFHAQPKRIH
jgi:hypothetical protein